MESDEHLNVEGGRPQKFSLGGGGSPRKAPHIEKKVVERLPHKVIM